MNKLNLIFVLICSVITTVSTTQKMTPEQVVQENLDFYNSRNIEGFMSSFSKSIKMYNLEEPKPTIVGFSEVKEVYNSLFQKSPQLHSTILKRIVIGNKVIDHESIVGRNGSNEILELVLIYEVTNEQITKITVIRK
mgnify:CR=1 FL=1|tara:strand:- start:4189 stop:4599 length:411 start_codon:yes stop_codon:yes gene_type:complete